MARVQSYQLRGTIEELRSLMYLIFSRSVSILFFDKSRYWTGFIEFLICLILIIIKDVTCELFDERYLLFVMGVKIIQILFPKRHNKFHPINRKYYFIIHKDSIKDEHCVRIIRYCYTGKDPFTIYRCHL